MPSVNAEIKRIIRDKDSGILGGTEAMQAILKELQTQVQRELGQAALGSWDVHSLKKMLNSVERNIADAETKAKAEITGLTDDAWQMGMNLVDAPLEAAGIYTGFNISKSSMERLMMKDFAEHIIKGLYGDGWLKIKSELTLGVLGGKTPQEVSKVIGQNLDEPSIFTSLDARAEAITKTEMGRVFSAATQARMEEAAGHVEGLEKQWLHAGHPRAARPLHLALNGLHVPVDEPFLVGNVAMMYPRDPAAPLSEVINCGCDHVPYHERWQ